MVIAGGGLSDWNPSVIGWQMVNRKIPRGNSKEKKKPTPFRLDCGGHLLPRLLLKCQYIVRT